MAETRYEDLYAATTSTSVETLLAGRLDAAVQGVTSTEDEKKTVTGIIGRTANVGYLIIRLAARTVATIDLASLNGMSVPLPLNIPVPVGQTLGFSAKNSSGTALIAVTALYEKG